MAVFNGTNTNNTLNGTNTADVMNGLGGNDTLNGNGGDDTLTGGTGDDILNGGENADTYLVGIGDGFDKYQDTGTTGTDRIRATANDTVIGIKGNFSAANGIEHIDGDGRTGVIIRGDAAGNTLDFSLIALTWIAQIDGGAGNDTITGSAADDTIVGGTGSDTLNGGEGSDTYLFTTGDGRDTYKDSGTGGIDQILATAANTEFTLASGFGPASGIEVISANGFTGVTIQGSGSGDTLDFSLTVLNGVDSIDGGTGWDLITGSSGNDTIHGGDGSDTLGGHTGDDTLIGGSGADTLKGDAGMDTLIGGTGVDVLDGGEDSDTYVFNAGDGRDAYADSGLSGIDKIIVTADNVAIILPLVFQPGAGMPAGGIEEISANGFSGVTIQGSGSGDTLDFSLTTLTGIANIDGGSGWDFITGSAGNDTILGGDGGDTLKGQAGDDTLMGEGGTDTLKGEAGDDTLIGGTGVDVLDGGEGSDIYVFNPGDGRDTYSDSGVSGTDKIIVMADNVEITLPLVFLAGAGAPAGGIEEISANGFSGVTIRGSGSADTLDFSLTLLTGIANVDTGGGWDFVTGSAGSDTILGGDGSDTLKGHLGDDTLMGESGGDTLLGEAGNDTLVGGTGSDILDGGEDSDTYLYGAGDGRDTYGDTGTSGIDRILVTTDDATLAFWNGFGPANGIEEIDAGGHANVTIEGNSGNNTLDFSMTLLTGIASISGGSGADTITGSSNGDAIFGNSGADVLKGGGGNDTIDGGSGFDTAVFNGNVRDYLVVVTSEPAGQAAVTDLAPTTGGNDGTDTLNSIAAIQFDDYTIYLNGSNNAVLAGDDAATTPLGTPLVITAASLVANDFDFDGDTLTITAVQNAVNGTAVLNPDGTISFTPAPGFSGQATFDYVVTDGAGSTDTGRMTITVLGDPSGDNSASLPTLTAQQANSGAENTAIPLVISAGLSDNDGSESLALRIDFEGPGMVAPIGATLSDGGGNTFTVTAGNTSVDITGWDLDNLTITPPVDTDRDIVFKVTATSTELNGGATAEVSEFVGVTVVSAGTGVEEIFQLETLIATNGFRLDGPVADADGDGSTDSTDFGRSVSEIGDINGDGYADVIVGARSVHANDVLYSGASYVVFGGAGGFPSSLSVDDLDGTNGFRLDGIAGLDNAGYAVSGGGDFNGDGHDDLIISAPFADSGNVYVVFGHTGAFPATAGLASAVEFHDSSSSQIGLAVGDAGDVNGDGLSDLIIGRDGGAAIVYGSTTPAGSFDLATLNGTNGFVVTNAPFAGSSVSGAGDVNGDGYDDIIVGTNAFGTAGDAYVVFGGPGGVADVHLGELDGNNGFRMTVANGAAVSSAGDVNGDGFDDLIIGAAYSDTQGDQEAGISYVVFGKAGGFDAVVDVDALDGTNGFRIEGAEADDRLGIAVSSAGDVNADGYDDLIVATQYGGNTFPSSPVSGQTYIVFGNGGEFSSTLDLASLTAEQGVRLDGGFSISSVAAAGDVNGDGFDDIVIGAPNTGSGVSYVIFGGTHFQGPATAYAFGTTGDDVLVGLQSDPEIVMGDLGNDELSGGLGDVLNGGAGDDVFHFSSSANNTIVGGSGFDTLKVSGFLDLSWLNTTAHYGQITGIEQIDMTDGSATELMFDPVDLLHLSDEQHSFYVLGDNNDQIDIGEGWTEAGSQMVNGTNFNVYVLGVTTLYLDSEIDFLLA